MYLTRIDIDPYSSHAPRLLQDTYAMHQVMCDLADQPRSEANLLHRIVSRNNRVSVYVYSAQPLDHNRIARGLRLGGERDLTPLFDGLKNGQVLAFDLVTMPSKKIRQKDRTQNSRRVLLRNPAERKTWLERQLERFGMKLLSVTENEAVHAAAWQRRRKNAFQLRGYHYTGYVRITDADLARDAISRGIGPERAFGFGMLMVRPV